jgi:hypothetical protein
LYDAFASIPQQVKNDSFPIEILNEIEPYLPSETLVFFGHYWMDPSDFGLLSNNICCLDFSVANGGNVGGYRFGGESELDEIKLLKNY